MVYLKSHEGRTDDTVGGSLPPPPCQAAQGALAMMFLYLAEKHNISACLDSGDMLQTIKMPGGHIPWNCDGDVVVIEKNSSDAIYTRDTVRVTTKKMKFEARKLKFCTWGLVGRPDPKIEKKIQKNSRLRKMRNFDI